MEKHKKRKTMINKEQISAIREMAYHLDEFNKHKGDNLISINQLLFVLHKIEDFKIDGPTEEGGVYYNKEGILKMLHRISDLMSFSESVKEILPTLEDVEELQYQRMGQA